MLNETASSTQDRPALRSSVRLVQGADDVRHSEIRAMVATVFQITDETFDPRPELLGQDGLLLMNPGTRFLATFEGHLMIDSEAAYDQLDTLMKPANLLPVFRLVNERQVIHVLEGRVQPKQGSLWINGIMFALTIFGVLEVGTTIAISEIADRNMFLAFALQNNFYANLWRGLPYGISILLILGIHELGHYFAARRHKVAVSLPYFIPAPFIGLLGIFSLGTFGAFIRLREPMRNRKVLMDVGVAGPLAGFLVAIPILLIGLNTSRVELLSPEGWMEGNSIFYAFSKILVFGRFLPDGQYDVYLNQMAMAGWAGLLVTALNLIPIGQLDGGHILYSLVGQRAKVLYYPLVAIAFLLSMRTEAWLVWALLIIVFGRVYAAPLDTITTLNTGRRAVGVLALVIFFLTFVPIPISFVTNAAAPAPRDSAFLMSALVVGMVMLWQRARH